MKLIAMTVTALIATILTPARCFAQATFVTHVAAHSSTLTVTTNPIDTSSCTTHCAEFLFLTVSWGVPNTPMDSNGNSWQEVPGMYIKNPGYGTSELYACYNCKVGRNQTFSTSGHGPAIAVLVFDNVAGFDKGATKLWVASPVGPITPANNDEVIVTFFGGDSHPSGAPSLRSRFAPSDAIAGTRSETSIGSAYLIQTAAAAESPHWTETGGNGKQQLVAAFYSTKAPAPLSVSTTSLSEGFRGGEYSFQLQATGGILPYTWRQTAGNPLSAYGLSLSSSGLVRGTSNTLVSATPITFQVRDSIGKTASSSRLTLTIAATAPAITTASCPSGTQLRSYAGCSIAATGGTPPYKFSIGPYPYASLPEGISLNPSTGAVTSSLIGGQGTYGVQFIATDAAGATAARQIDFAIQGNNAYLQKVFPSDSIFHHRVDAATTGLPVDTSPAAPIYRAYLPARIAAGFGNSGYGPHRATPNGIPAIEVPYNQPGVAVTTFVWQCYFGTHDRSGPHPAYNRPCGPGGVLGPATAPIPNYAPIEATCSQSVVWPGTYAGDGHVLVYREPGGGKKPALYEMNVSQAAAGQCGNPATRGWSDDSNVLWPDVASDALTPQGYGTADAAGLPVAPLLLTADEVIGTGTPSAPNGIVRHPVRFTLRHMLPYWVWPATEAAGVGSCTDARGKYIRTYQQISQGSSRQASFPLPVSCPNSTAVAGEIYRLKASVSTPSCAATSPQSAIIITALRDYGMILADNGLSGRLIGTPDTRWNDSDLACLQHLTLADFEPVNVSSLKVSNSSGQTSK